MLASEYSEQKI